MSQALKILQITNRLPYPLNDGGNIATYYLTKFLKDAGHQTHLLSLNTKKHYHSPQPLEEVAQVATVDIDTTVSVWGAFKGLFGRYPYNISRFQSQAFEAKLIDLLQIHNFDIVQTEGIYMGIYLDDIRKHSKAKVVLRAHNLEHQIWRRLADNNTNPLKKIYLGHLAKGIEKFEQEYAQQYDGIVAITEVDSAYFTKVAPNTPTISIPAGIDFEVFQSKMQEPLPNTLCFLGSLEWQPNTQGLRWFLDEVWPMVYQANPNLSFHIAGKNPPEEWQNLREEGVVMHGMVPDAQAFLAKYELMVVPLLSGSGMRLKLIEAMAMQKCIVSTSVGAEGIPCTNKELLIVDDAQKMSETILNLCANAGQKTAMKKNAYNFVKRHYDWNSLIPNFTDFYRALV